MSERLARPGRTEWTLAAAGLLAGVLVVALLPHAALFVGDGLVDSGQAVASGSRYACPMFCVVMDRIPADRKCPVCGMTLQEVRDTPALDAHEQAMIGIVAERLRRIPLERVVRQVGEVDYDETRLSKVTTRTEGFLEEVHVSETWVPVEAGEKLVEIYSPVLYAAQGDYLIAWKSAGRPDDVEEVSDVAARNALVSTETRLRNLGIDDEEIAAVRASGKPRSKLALRAPRDGVVIRRNVVENSAVRTGDVLYVIADLSSVWIQVEVFEHERPWIVVGQRVDLRTDVLPGRVIEGRVQFVDPIFDRTRRTTRVRVIADNPHLIAGGRVFRPGQRVDARIHTHLGRDANLLMPGEDGSYSEPPPNLLAIPRSAVLRTGLRSVAFVLYEDRAGAGGAVTRAYDLDPDRLPQQVGYEMVELRLGSEASSIGENGTRRYFPVFGVVAPEDRIDPDTGEKVERMGLRFLTGEHLVVTEGNFLLDSQAQLAGKPSLLFPDGADRTTAGGEPTEHRH